MLEKNTLSSLSLVKKECIYIFWAVSLTSVPSEEVICSG